MATPASRGHAEDLALVSAVITDASLCATCIARKTGIPLAQVKCMVAEIASALRVASAGALCDACLLARKVFRLA